MASWKEIVTVTPGDSQISSVSIQAATSFAGILSTANGGTGNNNLGNIDNGLLYHTGNNWESLVPTNNNIIGVDSSSGLVGSIDLASAHVHSDLISLNSNSEVDGELWVNGNLTVDTLNVTSLDITQSGDNFFTVNNGNSAATAGFEVYLDGTNDARFQWDNSQSRWEFGISTGVMYQVGGTYTQASADWSGDPTSSGIKSGTLGLDTITGACYIAVSS